MSKQLHECLRDQVFSSLLQLAESHKNIDPEEYDRMKNELQQTKVKF